MNNETTSKNIIIYGSGGLGRGIIELITAINKVSDNKWNVLGIVDDYSKTDVHNLPYLGNINYLLNYQEKTCVALAMGNPEAKYDKYQFLKQNKNLLFPNLIHPNVYIPQTLTLGKGNIISSGVSFSADINIGNFNLIHFNSSIGHDVFIENYNSIYPLTALSGYVRLYNKIEVGSNATIIPGITVGDKAIIGAGSVVLNNIKSSEVVAGVPSKVIRYNNEGL